MKICLVSEYFYPKSTGGTEKYVYELAKKLISEKNEVEVLTAGPIDLVNYVYDGILVRVIGFVENLDSFESILKSEKYDRLHFHTITPTFNTNHMALARETDAHVVFTAHIPAVTCIHGDLMQFGKIACDGLILKHRCTACYISKRNISKVPSNLIARLVNHLNYPESTAGVVEKKMEEVEGINKLCDTIFIFTDWQKKIFIKNGFNPEKLIKIQQMEVPLPATSVIYPSIPKKGNKLKIGYAGRIGYEKGIHVLLKAFLKSKTENLELHIAAIINNKQNPYFQKLAELTKGKSNIFWKFNLDHIEIQDFYQTVDLVCIPSIGYETGPYVLYEAIKYELPVITNNLGDMDVWRKKGYQITTYNNQKELTALINML